MFSEHSVARAASAAGIRAPVHFLDTVGSTNAETARMAEEGAPDWTVVVANQQDAGRGRLGRTWVSSPGSSLLVSVLVRPSLRVEEAAVLTLGAGACAALACAVACGVDTRCKWPNDLVVGGRKLGGVLVEARVEGNRLAHAVIGVGVNVKQGRSDFPPELREIATSVAIEGGRPNREALLYEFLMRLKRFADPSAERFQETVLDLSRRISATLGRMVRATTTSGRIVRGRAVAIGDSGELLIDGSTGRDRIVYGEIEHLLEDPPDPAR